MKISENGQLTQDGSARICKSHGEHGFLYVCPEYSADLQLQIKNDGKRFAKECREGTIIININGKKQMWKDMEPK